MYGSTPKFGKLQFTIFNARGHIKWLMSVCGIVFLRTHRGTDTGVMPLMVLANGISGMQVFVSFI